MNGYVVLVLLGNLAYRLEQWELYGTIGTMIYERFEKGLPKAKTEELNAILAKKNDGNAIVDSQMMFWLEYIKQIEKQKKERLIRMIESTEKSLKNGQEISTHNAVRNLTTAIKEYLVEE